MIDIFATVIGWIIGMVVGFVFVNGISFIFNLNPIWAYWLVQYHDDSYPIVYRW